MAVGPYTYVVKTRLIRMSALKVDKEVECNKEFGKIMFGMITAQPYQFYFQFQRLRKLRCTETVEGATIGAGG